MVKGDEEVLQVFRFRGIERRVEVGPAKELRLVAGEEIRLRVRARQLQPRIHAVEAAVAERNGAVGLGMRPRHIRRQALTEDACLADITLVKLLPVEPVRARRQQDRAGRLHRPPAVGHRAHRGGRGRHRLLRPGEDLRRAQHGRRHGRVGGIVSGLRIDHGHGPELETGVFKNAATDGHIRLGLGEVARLHVHLRFEAQRRNRGGKRAGGRLVGDPRGIDQELRQADGRHLGAQRRGQEQGGEQIPGMHRASASRPGTENKPELSLSGHLP